ncbi:MAG: VCBS repeat-containing protein, partial [Bacteroidia bacterium]
YGSNQQRMHNCLQLNNGNGTFSDIAMLAGVYRTDWSWAPLFADFDNDGWKDLLITNGYYRDVTNSDLTVYMAEQMRKSGGRQDKSLNMINSIPTTPITNYVYKNNGDLTFADKTYEWGLDQKNFSNGACYADLDNDGDLEIIINNLGDSALVYENKSNEINHSNFLKIKLIGPKGNTNGIGAVITVHAGGNSQVQQMFPSRGYMSACDNRMNFGLGKHSTVDTIEIKWQGGKTQRMENVKANQELVLDYKNVAAVSTAAKQTEANLFFEKAGAKYQINFTHIENEFIDFKREPLLPHEFSKGGPFITKGDVNGDHIEDFFIGNAKGSSGKMFIQKPDGSFIENNSQPWEQDKMQEDIGCLLFDSDSDKDLDLYVVSGGSEENAYSDFYQDRLYINNGKGSFKKCNDCLPKINSSGSCVVAADYDRDGDNDLFRGGMVLPSVYPMPATSYLLNNNNGKFTDVITTVAPELQHAGMIKDAVWCDFNNDTKTDLVICGEWIPIMMFQNNANKFEIINKNQNGALTAGWWNKIVASDFDHDGDVDFVAGNYGLNAKLKASPEKPLIIVAKDFDGNQTLDAIICNYEIDGKNYPIYSRDVMTDQVRPLKKKLLKYADYYDKTIDQIFPADSLKKANVLMSYMLASCYIENAGNGNLQLHPLPVEAQFAPVNGIIVDDFNKDGNSDLLLAGNSYAESVDLGLCDAGTGLLLLGDGEGKFNPVLSRTSGFNANKDVRSIAVLQTFHNKKIILVANNNSKAEVFSVK